jgi:hypothetical protein
VFGSYDSLYAMESHLKHLRNVVIPAGERRMAIERELTTLDDAQPGSVRRALTVWLGERLVRAGERLRTATPSAEARV